MHLWKNVLVVLGLCTTADEYGYPAAHKTLRPQTTFWKKGLMHLLNVMQKGFSGCFWWWSEDKSASFGQFSRLLAINDVQGLTICKNCQL